jgi:predicted transcriptional regulator
MTTSIKIEGDLEKRIQDIAQQRKVPAADLALDALSAFVDGEARRASFREDAVRAWQAYGEDGLHLTAEEADAWLARLEAGDDLEPPACHN